MGVDIAVFATGVMRCGRGQGQMRGLGDAVAGTEVGLGSAAVGEVRPYS